MSESGPPSRMPLPRGAPPRGPPPTAGGAPPGGPPGMPRGECNITDLATEKRFLTVLLNFL